MCFILALALFITCGIRAQSPNDSSAYYADYYGQYKFDSSFWTMMIDGVSILWENGTIKMHTHTNMNHVPFDMAGSHNQIETWKVLLSMNNAILDMNMVGQDSFHMAYMNGAILFKRDGNKKVNQIVVMVSGAVLTGTKQSVGEVAPLRRKNLRG